MNFSFEGEFRRRRNINLGGALSSQNKSNLIAKAHSERKARELERLRVSSALKIQSFYRGRRSARVVCGQCSDTLEHHIPLLKRDPSISIASECLRCLLTLYRIQPYHADHTWAYALCELLATPFKNGSTLIQLGLVDKTEKEAIAWLWQLKLFTGKVVMRVMQSEMQVVHLEPSFRFLETMVDPARYRILGNERSSRAHQGIVYYCIERVQLLDTIRSVVLRFPDASRRLFDHAARWMCYAFSCQSESNDKLKLLSAEALGTRSSSMVISMACASSVLTIPFFINDLDAAESSALCSALEQADIMAAIQAVIQTQSDSNFIPGLLINLVDLEQKIDLDMAHFTDTIQLLVARLPPKYVEKAADPMGRNMRSDDDDDDEEENMKEDTDEEHDNATSVLSATPRLKERLGSLFNAQSVVHFAKQFSLAASQDDDQILSMCQLFSTIILRMPHQRDTILNTLLYHQQYESSAQVSLRLWHTWTRTSLATLLQSEDRLFQSDSLALVRDPTLAKTWSVLWMLCELYTLLLLTIGDDEFFNPTNTQLSKQQMVDLGHQLKNISFFFFWHAGALDMTAPLNQTGLTAEQLRTGVTLLLQQIHMRDARRQFCPPEHWLIKRLDTSGFIDDAISEELRLDQEMGTQAGPSSAAAGRSSRPLSKSRLARLSPHLGILNNIPFVIPFEQRVGIFRAIVDKDRQRHSPADFFFTRVGPTVTIRRGHVFEDGLSHLYSMGSRLKGKVSIVFVDEFGLEEAGIDGGGVFKEFLTSLGQEAFNTDYGLFKTTPDQFLYPNPAFAIVDEDKMYYYEFLGLMIGKALYEGILLDVAFANFFLKACFGRLNYLDDLPSLDPELYKGLIQVKNFPGDVRDLCLDFTLTDQDFGESTAVELVPNGSQIQVTNDNRINYVYRVANYRLNTQMARPSRAFFHGLSTLVDVKWLRMFNEQELQILLGGVTAPIDLEDLKKHTVYGGYSETDAPVVYFWRAMESFTHEERQNLLKFVTSCARPPLLGFKELRPLFSIRRAEGTNDRLPTSSTCVNLLKLPPFTSYDILREKLLYAITAGAGFDLS